MTRIASTFTLTISAALATAIAPAPTPAQAPGRAQPTAATWTRGATCYEVFVRSFYDSDGDGVGDLPGLTSKLDYINDGDPRTQRDLGARCIWLMPIMPSPSYHGYDVTDYYGINPEYGTEEDFKRFMAEAHKRGIRVLIDMVLNHSSSEHPFFKHAALHPDSPWRDWYIWLPKHPGVKNPWGGDNWHRSPSRDEFYYGFFWGGMPDLNVESRGFVEEAKKIATYWFQEMGVDGFRLDAIKHLAEAEQGRKVENLPATHVFLREYAAHIRRVKPDAYTVGEVMDSIGAMMAYYPDQLDSHFAFEAADAVITAVRGGSAKRMLPPFLRLQRELPHERWSHFLRNHDQTRTLTELKGDIAGARVAATLLLTLPGLPFVYYGEEIGMTGDKPDPRLRTPMHWSRGPAAGFTRGMPWEPLQPDSLTANVEAQESDPRSLLNLHRTLIHLRAENAALAGGELVALSASDSAVAAYVRRAGDRAVLVVANLGAAPLTGVSLTAPRGTLGAGTWSARSLLGGPAGAPLRVASDGRIMGYLPRAVLEAKEAYVFELTRGQRTRTR